MKIHARNFATAGAATVCIIYSFFALSLKLWPAQVLKLIGTTHMLPKLELIKSFIKVTPQAVAMGLLSHVAAAFVFFWLIATIYNRLQK